MAHLGDGVGELGVEQLVVPVHPASFQADAGMVRYMASAASRAGMPGMTPSRVQTRAPQATPKRAASSTSLPSARATAKPELKASPAPVVSTTSIFAAG